MADNNDTKLVKLIGAERAEQIFNVRPVNGCAALRKKQ
jgi:hypothetical protein